MAMTLVELIQMTGQNTEAILGTLTEDEMETITELAWRLAACRPPEFGPVDVLFSGLCIGLYLGRLEEPEDLDPRMFKEDS